MGSLFAPCVLLKVWNFSTVKPAPPPPNSPLHAYQVNHTCSLSHFPLSVSLSVPHAHKLTFIHCFTLSQLALHSVAQASYTLASSAAPLGPRNRRCSAQDHSADLFCCLSRSLSYSPSLACLCLLSVHSCCHWRFSTSPLSLRSDRQHQFTLFFFWKELSFFVLLCPNHAFPRPPLTSSSSQPRRA